MSGWKNLTLAVSKGLHWETWFIPWGRGDYTEAESVHIMRANSFPWNADFGKCHWISWTAELAGCCGMLLNLYQLYNGEDHLSCCTISNNNILLNCDTQRQNSTLNWICNITVILSRISLECQSNYVSIKKAHRFPFSGSTLLVGWQEGHPACKKLCIGDDDLTGALHVL